MPSSLSKSICNDCIIIHGWNPSCIGTSFDVWLACAKYSLKIYTIVYSISFVIGRKGKGYFKTKLLPEILQSSLFLACNGGFFAFYLCLVRKILGKFYAYSIGFIPGFLASLSAILVERKSRRKTLALYMLNQAYDTIFSWLKDRGYVKDVKYGEVVIFSMAMALLMYMFSSGSLPDGFVKTILRKTFKGKKYDEKKDEDKKDEDKNTKNQNSDQLNDDTASNPSETNRIHPYESNLIIAKKSVLLGTKVFCLGSSLHTAYSMLTSLPKLFKKPGDFFYKAVLKKNNYMFGAWLGSYAGLYVAMSKLLRRYYKEQGHVNNAVAGGLAGMSMFWYRDASHAMYIATKVFELLYVHGIEKGVVPYIKNFDTMLYAVSTAIMFHVAVLQPLYLKPTYFRFLENLTGHRFIQIQRDKLEEFGYDSMKLHRLPCPNAYTNK